METSNSPVNVNNFLPDIVFDHEDGGDMYLRKFRLSAACTALQPRRLYQYSSWYLLLSAALTNGNITELKIYVKGKCSGYELVISNISGDMPTLPASTTIFVIHPELVCSEILLCLHMFQVHS